MRRAVIMVLGFMILFTAGFIGVTAYRVGFLEGKLQAEEAALVKDPIQYGIYKSFSTMRLETEPVTWYTAEQLGVVLIRAEYQDCYRVYVVSGQEDRALGWMTQADTGSYVSPVVKHGDEFYKFGFLWVTPSVLSTSVQSIVIVPLLLLAVGWGIFAIVAFLSYTHGERI